MGILDFPLFIVFEWAGLVSTCLWGDERSIIFDLFLSFIGLSTLKKYPSQVTFL